MAGTGDHVTLAEFLKVLFPVPQGAVDLVEAIPGKAGAVFFVDHSAVRWDGPAGPHPLYVCISTCEPVGPRSRKPSRKHPVLTYLVVLDDVGTKVPVNRLPAGARPTYALETSSGNFQLGFRLKDPVAPARAGALIDALAGAGFTDPGSKSDVRLVRVPGSLNGKPATGDWRARLTTWNPEVAYTFSELATLFGVTPADTSPRSSVPELALGESDPVAEWATSHAGAVGGASGAPVRGLIPILCPQHDLHTVGIERSNDSSSVWIPGSPGAYHCTHGHCSDFRTREYLAWIAKNYPGDGPKAAAPIDLDRLGAAIRGVVQGTDAAGGLFPPLNHDARVALGIQPLDMSLVARLRDHVGACDLGPWQLPAPDRTLGGTFRTAQTVTQPRVYAVMDVIGMTVRFNALTRRSEYGFPALPWYDPDADVSGAAENALVHACARCDMKGDRQIQGYLAQRAFEETYHPVLEWILSAVWDGVDRMDQLFQTVHLRQPKHAAWRDVAIRKWMIQTCAALDNFDRGRKAVSVGYTLVLQGTQRRGKSLWVESLLPRGWVSIGMSLRLDSSERDAVLRATQTPITELGEVDAIFRKADIASLKNFLTTPVDIYRRAYGKTEEALPRCTTFIATVNPEGFLVDSTGEGRFWPIPVSHCVYDHGIDLQQLWAQAWDLYDAGENWGLVGAEAELHAQVATEHRAMDQIMEAVTELMTMRDAYPDTRGNTNWHVTQAGEILQWKGIRKGRLEYSELASHLERAGFGRSTVHGMRGWRVPDWNRVHLSTLQRAGLKIIQGKEHENEG